MDQIILVCKGAACSDETRAAPQSLLVSLISLFWFSFAVFSKKSNNNIIKYFSLVFTACFCCPQVVEKVSFCRFHMVFSVGINGLGDGLGKSERWNDALLHLFFHSLTSALSFNHNLAEASACFPTLLSPRLTLCCFNLPRCAFPLLLIIRWRSRSISCLSVLLLLFHNLCSHFTSFITFSFFLFSKNCIPARGTDRCGILIGCEVCLCVGVLCLLPHVWVHVGGLR